MKKMSLILIAFLLCGCISAQEQPLSPRITFKDKAIITSTDVEYLKEFIDVKDESEVNTEISYENHQLCVLAENEYGKTSEACHNYEFKEMKYDFDYEHLSLDEVLNLYTKEKNIENKVYYFYYNTTTEEEVLYRENEIFLAASTVKVPMSIAFTDLIYDGKMSYDTTLLYTEGFYEASAVDLTYFYPFGSRVPISDIMKYAIIYSDNSCANMMKVYYKNYGGETFREWLSHYSDEPVSSAFYQKNQATASIMLKVMKQLYGDQEKYSRIIEDMKIAAKGEYIQANHFDFDVAQKYGNYSYYEHTMAILFAEQPLLVGVFTDLSGRNAKQVIQEMSYIMYEYTLANM